MTFNYTNQNFDKLNLFGNQFGQRQEYLTFIDCFNDLKDFNNTITPGPSGNKEIFYPIIGNNNVNNLFFASYNLAYIYFDSNNAGISIVLPNNLTNIIKISMDMLIVQGITFNPQFNINTYKTIIPNLASLDQLGTININQSAWLLNEIRNIDLTSAFDGGQANNLIAIKLENISNADNNLGILSLRLEYN